jgi:hypothetical protein
MVKKTAIKNISYPWVEVSGKTKKGYLWISRYLQLSNYLFPVHQKKYIVGNKQYKTVDFFINVESESARH